MPFTKSRPKIDVDTEKSRTRRPTWAPRSPTPPRARRATRRATAAVARPGTPPSQAKDWTTPKVEAFIDWLLPRVEHLYKESVKAAAPKVESAADEGVAGHRHRARQARRRPPAQAGRRDERGRGPGRGGRRAGRRRRRRQGGKGEPPRVAAAAAEASGKKKHTGAKVFWLLAALIGLGAGRRRLDAVALERRPVGRAVGADRRRHDAHPRGRRGRRRRGGGGQRRRQGPRRHAQGRREGHARRRSR